jgi:iron-sulfur cluster repair protein YtfE (RIC family)
MNNETTSGFDNEHAKLVKLFNYYRDAKNENLTKAKELFKDFSGYLQRHMKWEETVLIPFLKQDKSTSYDNSIDIIRTEHIKILAYLKDLHEKIDKGLAVEKEEERLIRNLLKHEEFEDEILHPAIIKLIKKEVKEDIFKSMDNL